MNPRADTHRRGRVALVLVPWLVYVGVTLVAPAMHGATRDAGFVEHTVITLGVSGALAMLWLAAARPRAPRSTARRGKHPHLRD